MKYQTEAPILEINPKSNLILPKEYMKEKLEIEALEDDFTPKEIKEGEKKGFLYPKSEHIYKRNLSIIKKMMGESIAEQFLKLAPKEILIDKEINVSNLKNPLILIIIGFTTIRVLRDVLRQKKTIQTIIIIEPNLYNFNEAIKRDDISEFLEKENIDLLLGTELDQLLPELFKMLTKADRFGPRASRLLNAEVIYDPFAYPIKDGKANEEGKKIQEIIQETLKHIQLSMGCADDSATRWKAMLKNLDNIKDSYKSQAMLGKIKDIPIIVCGGGPSFEEGLSHIKEKGLDKKALIIACDAVLPKMLKFGIKPHIITRAERKHTQIFENDVYQNLTQEDTKDIYYAAYPWTHPEFFKLFSKKLAIFRTNGVCLWTEIDAGKVNGGVSAANAALELAYELCGKNKGNLVITGIDLCFIGDKSHTSDTKVEFDIFKSKSKWNKIKGNSGEVTTIPVWLRCLNEYRQAIVKKERAKNFTVYNTSLKGAFISGTELKRWEELDFLFKEEKDIWGMLKSMEEKVTQEEAKKLDENIDGTILYLKKCKSDIEEAFRSYHDSLLTVDGEATKLMNRLKNEPYWKNFYQFTPTMREGIGKLMETSCHHLDLFRQKYFQDIRFRLIILDICQLDFFQCENLLNSTWNRANDGFEKMSIYSSGISTFLTVCEYYINDLLKTLLEIKEKKAIASQELTQKIV